MRSERTQRGAQGSDTVARWRGLVRLPATRCRLQCTADAIPCAAIATSRRVNWGAHLQGIAQRRLHVRPRGVGAGVDAGCAALLRRRGRRRLLLPTHVGQRGPGAVLALHGTLGRGGQRA